MPVDHHAIRGRVRPMLGRGEPIAWTGESARGAYLASHVVPLVFAAVFSYATCGTIIATLLRGGMPPIGIPNGGFAIIGAVVAAHAVISVVRDLDVSWAITDRRVIRLSKTHAISTDITGAASLEIERAGSGGGTLIIRMPERRDVEGDKVYPSVRLTGIDDVHAAHAAASEATRHGRVATDTMALPQAG